MLLALVVLGGLLYGAHYKASQRALQSLTTDTPASQEPPFAMYGLDAAVEPGQVLSDLQNTAVRGRRLGAVDAAAWTTPSMRFGTGWGRMDAV